MDGQKASEVRFTFSILMLFWDCRYATKPLHFFV